MKTVTKAAIVAMAEPKDWLKITPDDRLRFSCFLEISGIHMLWTGSRNGTYGQFKFRSETKEHPQVAVGAHVFAFYNTHSLYLPSLSELKVLDIGHTCTEHLCCEPLHLYLSTHAANMEEQIKYRDGDMVI